MKLKDFNKKIKKEYQDTLVPNQASNKKFHFKFRYAVSFVLVVFVVALIIQHIVINNYNQRIEQHNETLRNEQIDVTSAGKLSLLQSEKDYESIVLEYQQKRVYKEEKQSILSKIFSMQPFACSAPNGDRAPAPTHSDDNSYYTNIQTEGIEEADVAKCDGEYIYNLFFNQLLIYDINKNSVVSRVEDFGSELFVHQNKIITIGKKETRFYTFNQNVLTFEKKLAYERVLTSRMMHNDIYLVTASFANEDRIHYQNCYYDLYSLPSSVYTIYKIDNTTNDIKEVQFLSENNVILYASSQAFYFASKENYFTSIAVFSLDLVPMNVLRVEGQVLNQFSMDEYESTFRVVSSNHREGNEKINALSIFDRDDNYKRIGYLKEGIGKKNQTVKSVRFSKNICYIVTYENSDPLYEIDCSNPKEPVILSSYESPGYSNYLHIFQINQKEYILGLGYTDSLASTKISLYEKNKDMKQIGKDFVLSFNSNFENCDYSNSTLLLSMFVNHKALFFHKDKEDFYMGAQVAYDTYLIFKIDVDAKEDVISIYKEINLTNEKKKNSASARAFLVNHQLYVTDCDRIIVCNFYDKELFVS